MGQTGTSFRWPALSVCFCLTCTTVTEEGKTWSAAELLGDAPRAAFPVRVAMDGAGNAITAWFTTLNAILSQRYVPGVGWDDVQQIDSDQDTAFDPVLAVAPDGTAVIVWLQGNVEVERTVGLWSNRYTPDSGWGTAEPIVTDAAGDPRDGGDVAIDPDGNAITVWHQDDEAEWENVWASRSTPSVGWSAAELIETDDAGHAGDPRVAMDLDGNAIAVWHQSDGTRTHIWANRYTPDPGSGWLNAERIEQNDAGEARLPQVAMDPAGNAIAVWHHSDGTRFGVWAARYTRRDGWASPERIDQGEVGDADHAQVGLDANGNAIAVWKQFDGITAGVWANRYTPGGDWGIPMRIERNDDGDALPPRIAVSANGEAVAIWIQSDGLHLDIWSNAYVPGTGWGAARPIDPSSQEAGRVDGADIAIDPSGNAVAVWRRYDPASEGPGGSVWAARFE